MFGRVVEGRRSRAGSRGAFTLIELLVVIAIIALLIAILLPSLEAARRQSKQSACLSHLKNIGTSSRVYEADDEAGWGIPVHPLQYYQCGLDAPPTYEEVCPDPMYIGAYEFGGKSGIGETGYVDGQPAQGQFAFLSSKYGTAAGFGPATRPMNEILYKGGFRAAYQRGEFDRIQAQKDTELELELFKCPADNGPPRGAHCPDWVRHDERSSYDHFGNSYAANVFMIANAGGGEMHTNSPYMRPTSRVPTPARTLYYEENIGRWAWSCRRELDAAHDATGGGGCLWIGQGVDPGPTKAVRGWHGKDWTFNRCFVDGHGEMQKIYIEGTEDADGFALHYRNEKIYPEGDPFLQAHRCIIVRGTGWQKDTLPADLIGTGLWHSGGGRPSYENCVETE
jgi:prepilin-type N-terminal cleavage/methylation domain-containing protein